MKSLIFSSSILAVIVASTARSQDVCAVLGTKSSNACPDDALHERISSEALCRAAMRFANDDDVYGEAFGGSVDRSDRPAGCYRFGSWRFYFNKNTQGGKNAKSRPLCGNVTCVEEKSSTLFIGDSDIDLWDVRAAFPNSLNLGYSGYTCEDVLGEMDMWLNAFSPKQIVLVCGENDLGDRSASETFSYFKQIVAKANNAGASVLYLGTKPEPSTKGMHGDYREYDKLIFQFAKTGGTALAYIDVYASFETLGNENRLYADDRLHLSKSGYSYWVTWTSSMLSKPLCVAMRDGACVEERDAVTYTPTNAPTNPPTVAPTNAPTAAPTNPPTSRPTKRQNVEPTNAPATKTPSAASSSERIVHNVKTIIVSALLIICIYYK